MFTTLYFLVLNLIIMLSIGFKIINTKRTISRVTKRLFPVRMSSSNNMLSVHIQASVRAESDNVFYSLVKATSENILSIDGVLRYDVLRNNDDKSKFLMIKVFDDVKTLNSHKLTEVYKSYSNDVQSMLTHPKQTSRYNIIYPTDVSMWDSSSAGRSNHETSTTLPTTITPSSEPSLEVIAAKGMLAVVVDIKVIPESIDAFITATLTNCKSSLLEPGVTRFDFIQSIKDPTVFSLIEIYNSVDAPAAHKATAHYATWAKTVVSMMAQPRSATKYTTLFPSPLHYHLSSTLSHPSTRGLSNSVPSFSFLMPKLIMGRGIAAKTILSCMAELSIKNPFIVTGSSGFKRQADLFSAVFSSTGVSTLPHYCISSEPTVEDAIAATAIARQNGCDSVISIGGGSSIDLGKAVAALIANQEDVYEYLEVVGRGKPIQNTPVPFIAVPTTSGTGSEVTKNAVLKSKLHGVKASIRHDTMLPRAAIIDPVLTVSCPPDITAQVGLDTLCQVIEPYVSNAANPITDALAREGIIRASRSLRAVVADGSNLEAREDMSIACVLGGISLANAKLGIVHGFAAVLGGMFENAPHGAICASLLPIAFKMNVIKLTSLVESNDKSAAQKLSRFTDVARLLTGNPTATALQGAEWLRSLVNDLDIPGVSVLCGGIPNEAVANIASLTSMSSSTKGNPILLSVRDIEDLLRQAL